MTREQIDAIRLADKESEVNHAMIPAKPSRFRVEGDGVTPEFDADLVWWQNTLMWSWEFHGSPKYQLDVPRASRNYKEKEEALEAYRHWLHYVHAR